MAFMALPDIKRIHVYMNGNEYYPGTNFIVHPRRIRNFEVFLKDLTDKLKPGFGAIRNVYTPVNGSRVRDLEDLENNQRYVAAGKEGFHRLQYIGIEQQQAMKRAIKKSTKASKPPSKLQKSVAKSYRKRPYPWEPVVLNIYRNGDDVTPPVKLAVRRSDLDNWEQLLLRAGEKLDKSGYVKRLYNLNGDWVRGPNGIKSGDFYVAVGGYESFKHVMYGELLDRLPKEFVRVTAPKPRRKSKPAAKDAKDGPKKVVPKIKAPPILKNTKITKVNSNGNSEKVPGSRKSDNSPNIPTSQAKGASNALKLPTKSTNSIRNTNNKSNSVNAARRNVAKKKDGKSPPDSEDSAYLSEGESRNRRRGSKVRSFEVLNGVPPSKDVYYASPTRKARGKRVTVVDYDEDEGGVYRSKSKNPASRHAREVQELRHLPVDLPIDEVEATEVGEEESFRRVDEDEEVEEDDKRGDPKENYKTARSHATEKPAYSIENARRQLPSPTLTA